MKTAVRMRSNDITIRWNAMLVLSSDFHFGIAGLKRSGTAILKDVHLAPKVRYPDLTSLGACAFRL